MTVRFTANSITELPYNLLKACPILNFLLSMFMEQTIKK